MEGTCLKRKKVGWKIKEESGREGRWRQGQSCRLAEQPGKSKECVCVILLATRTGGGGGKRERERG